MEEYNDSVISMAPVATLVLLLLVSIAISSDLAHGLPMVPPNLWDCSPVRVRDDLVVDCCLPIEGQRHAVKEFQFPDPSEPMKVRKNAATLDAESIEKLNRAYLKMRALPRDDPRSMMTQQNIHCGYCAEVYKQQNSTQPLEIHRNWLLFPFHRWYVYFHERILGSLIDDPTFAIPYWNWDNQSSSHCPAPNVIPEYMITQPGLYDENRDPRHLPPNPIDLHWGPFFGDQVPEGTDNEGLRLLNDVFLHKALMTEGSITEAFLGGDYRFDEELPWSPALFEIGPHASVHGWVGNAFQPKGEDMAPAYAAARDPLFFQHHSNVDRIFDDWPRLEGGKRDLPVHDPDWMDASFLFFDEKSELVRVTVRQCLEIEKLRYSFEPTENSWVRDRSIPLSRPNPKSTTVFGIKNRAAQAVGIVTSWLGFSSSTSAAVKRFVDEKAAGEEIPDIESVRAPRRFSSSVFRSRVSRRHAAALRAAGQPDDPEEILVIDGIWVPSKKPIWFEIFINLPEADETTPLYATEWCGRFNNGPHLDRAGHVERKTVFRVTIGMILNKLGIADQSSLVVSLVPKGNRKHEREVQIDAIRIELR